MGDHDNLLQAVAERPGDGARRLVYADWLEEHGRTEAELARAECIRAHHDSRRKGVGDEEARALAERADELQDRHRAEWLAPLGLADEEAEFGGGLVEVVSTTAERFLRLAPVLSRRAPLQDL